MGKSPDEQPSLAVYKLRLASANSMASPFGIGMNLGYRYGSSAGYWYLYNFFKVHSQEHSYVLALQRSI